MVYSRTWLPTTQEDPERHGLVQTTFCDRNLRVGYQAAREAVVQFVCQPNAPRRRAAVEAANQYLTTAHRVKLAACSYRFLGVETFWVRLHYRIRALSFVILHILMALVAGLELYPGGLSKPWPVIVVTVVVVVGRVVGSQVICYKAQDPIWYSAWARISFLALGTGTALFKMGELLLIAYLVPSSRVVTARDIFNVIGPILVEIIAAVLLCLSSQRGSAIYLGKKGEMFEELNSRSVAGALTNHEKSRLLKVLFIEYDNWSTVPVSHQRSY